jgi:threonyl-tRNA synthetase
VKKDFSENKSEVKELSSADHRVLGQQSDLFSINEDVGIGLVLWRPKGDAVRRVIRDFWEQQHLKNGYQLVSTPHIAREGLWRISRHLDYYKDNMYLFEKENEGFVVKPMNCPFRTMIYKAEPRSYKELPIRYAEMGTVYRYERSGTLHGLLRVRGFTQDDAHIFCTPEQSEQEVLSLLDFTRQMLRAFGFTEFKVYLSTRDPKQPEKCMGSEEGWIHAQVALANALKKKRIGFTEMPGEAVFYGPKIDVNIVDASGRQWQCTTIQFDFNLPKRFKVAYAGADGKEHGVVMIHRALFGSLERFFAILLEHYEGNLPAWLAPVQVKVLSVDKDCVEHAKEVNNELQGRGIRAELDSSAATIGYKIRDSELRKIPYMAIVGKREIESGKIAVRKHRTGNVGSFTIEELIWNLKADQ